MESKKILVPFDFTTASEQALRTGIQIARKAELPVILAHLIDPDLPAAEKVTRSERLAQQARTTEAETGVVVEPIARTGAPGSALAELANHAQHQLMVMATHGIHGLRQKLFGADLLKILRKIAIPVWVVQEDGPVAIDHPVVLPVGGHKEFMNLAKAAGMIARLFGQPVQIYSVKKPGETSSREIAENVRLAAEYFDLQKIAWNRVEEDATLFSIGYARQTLRYAETIRAALIAVMSVPSEEHHYFAQTDKEMLLNNEFRIPVLCTSDLATC